MVFIMKGNPPRGTDEIGFTVNEHRPSSFPANSLLLGAGRQNRFSGYQQHQLLSLLPRT